MQQNGVYVRTLFKMVQIAQFFFEFQKQRKFCTIFFVRNLAYKY